MRRLHQNITVHTKCCTLMWLHQGGKPQNPNPGWTALPIEKSTHRLKWLTREAKFCLKWPFLAFYCTRVFTGSPGHNVTNLTDFGEILESRWGVWVKSQWTLHNLSPPCCPTHSTCRKGCANLSPVGRGCNQEMIKNNRHFHCSFKQDMARVILHHS